MDNWNRTTEQRKRGWRYLLENVAVDVMLLQECVPPDDIDDRYNVLFRGIGDKRPWGSAIVTKDFPLKEIEFKNSYPGAVVAAEVTLPDGQPLTVISLYGLFDEKNYVTAAMHRVLSDLTPLLHKDWNKRLLAVGGDYNLTTQWDERFKNRDPAHRIFFERLENFRLVNCTYKFFGQHVQTNRHSRSDFPWQNDYIHVSKRLAARLVSCEVRDDELVRELSDYNPVVAVFEM